MGKTERTIRRLLSELQEAGFIYRHFTTGPIGLSRKCIDLGPLIFRLPELQDGMAERAFYRAEVRADRSRCATLSEAGMQALSGPEDIPAPPNTQDLKYLSVPVIAQEKDAGAADFANSRGEDVSIVSLTAGRQQPGVIPPTAAILNHSPNMRAYLSSSPQTRPNLFDAAYRIALSWGLHRATWQTLCTHLGRDWTAVAVATVAELPPSRFNSGLEEGSEARRARYLAGIARKLTAGEEVNIGASWKRLAVRAGVDQNVLGRRLC
jgi:hypothetical protein